MNVRQYSTAEWQYKAAFVVQFRPETNIEAGQFEGRIEQISSHQAMRFHSLEDLLAFVASALAEICKSEEL